MVVGLDAKVDLLFFAPTYTFGQPVLGGQGSLALGVALVHDEQTVADAVMTVGADAVVLKSSLATDLMPAVDALLAGKCYVSPGISRGRGTQS